jgi:hypothetical protein
MQTEVMRRSRDQLRILLTSLDISRGLAASCASRTQSVAVLRCGVRSQSRPILQQIDYGRPRTPPPIAIVRSFRHPDESTLGRTTDRFISEHGGTIAGRMRA